MHTVDTDVVVIAIAMFNQINPDELWLAFGVGSNFRYILVHEVVSGMDPTILFMHSQDALLSHLLVEEERRVLGKPGKFFLMSLQHSNASF